MRVSNRGENPPVSTGELLDLSPLVRLHADLQQYRLADFQVDGLQADVPRMLPFIRGLYFSAGLIYAIREIAPASQIRANWGHVLREDSRACSPECDVILHSKCRSRWNGCHEHPVMDFAFVNPASTLAVISCKSLVRWPSDVDSEYAQNLRRHGVKRVWLFAECCPPGSPDRIAARAKAAGYQHFFHLYTMDPKTGAARPSEESWRAFVTAVRKLDGTSGRR
jgi:hypothetical protein